MKYTTIALVSLLAACSEEVKEHDHHHHDHEKMTAVELTFGHTDSEDMVVIWEDPEDDGDPNIGSIELTAGEEYTMGFRVLNQLETPVEDVTLEIAQEKDEHQVFFEGDIVAEATEETLADESLGFLWEYDDEDSNGLPVGLSNIVHATNAVSGELTVSLRHMPPQDGNACKAADMEDVVATDGLSSLCGASDIKVTFPVTISAAAAE